MIYLKEESKSFLKKFINDEFQLNILVKWIEMKIEENVNNIKEKHNELESKKIFGKKKFFSYESENFLNFIKEIEKESNE